MDKEERGILDALHNVDRNKKHKLEATYKLRDSINQLEKSIIVSSKAFENEISKIITALNKQTESEKSLQKWLILWTSIMAIGIIIQSFVLIYSVFVV